MKKEVMEAYEAMKPDEIAKQRMLNHIRSMASEESFAGKEKNMRKMKTKYFVRTAAAFAVVLGLPAIAYAAGMFRMEETSLGPKKIEIYTQPEEVEGVHDAEVKIEEVEVDMISLQGTSDSPEYKACREWLEFTDSYDSDEAILSQVGDNLVGLGDVYEGIYGCYTQEMADKLDEICEKYGLEKLEDLEIENDYKTICDRTGVGDIGQKTVENGVNDIYGEYYYSNGTFHMEGTASIPGETSCITDYELSRSVKGTFDSVALNVGDVNDYRQWSYTTENGVSVLLANSDHKALILVDREKSYIAINVLGNIQKDSFEVTDKNLETLAEMFDFSVIP